MLQKIESSNFEINIYLKWKYSCFWCQTNAALEVPWDSVEQNAGIFQRAPGPVARKDIKCSIYIYFVNIGETVFSIELVSFRDGFQLNSEQIIIGYQNLEKIEKLQNAIIVIE